MGQNNKLIGCFGQTRKLVAESLFAGPSLGSRPFHFMPQRANLQAQALLPARGRQVKIRLEAQT